MKITIVQDDGVVGVDGVFRKVDVSELAGEIHAIQFDTVLGLGHIEFDDSVTVDQAVRDFEAERAAERAAGDDREMQKKLTQINKTIQVQRPPELITDFGPYQPYLDRWTAAAPPPPTPAELAAAELQRLRGKALRALDDQRLAEAALDPASPQAVKDYVASLKAGA